MKLKLLGSEAAVEGTSSTNGGNVSLATLVRVHNSGDANRLVSLETSAAALKGTFTIGPGKTELLDKEPTDEIFAAHVEVLLAKVAYYS